MIDPRVIALAEIRRAELLEQAEQHRTAKRAAGSRRRGRQPWGSVVRDELTALRARLSAMQRPDLTKPTDLAPAATETT